MSADSVGRMARFLHPFWSDELGEFTENKLSKIAKTWCGQWIFALSPTQVIFLRRDEKRMKVECRTINVHTIPGRRHFLLINAARDFGHVVTIRRASERRYNSLTRSRIMAGY